MSVLTTRLFGTVLSILLPSYRPYPPRACEAEFVDFITLQDADQLSINVSGKAATVRDIIKNSILWPMPAESQVGLGVGLEQDEDTGSVVIAEIIPVSLGTEF